MQAPTIGGVLLSWRSTHPWRQIRHIKTFKWREICKRRSVQVHQPASIRCTASERQIDSWRRTWWWTKSTTKAWMRIFQSRWKRLRRKRHQRQERIQVRQGWCRVAYTSPMLITGGASKRRIPMGSWPHLQRKSMRISRPNMWSLTNTWSEQMFLIVQGGRLGVRVQPNHFRSLQPHQL